MASATQPLPVLAAALILGVVLAGCGALDQAVLMAARPAAILALLVGSCWVTARRRSPRLGTAVLAASGIGAGLLASPPSIVQAASVPIGEDRTIEGEICGLDRGFRGVELALCDVVDVARARALPRLLVLIEEGRPEAPPGPVWQRGHCYRLKVRFMSMGDARNPGASGRGHALRVRRGIGGRARLLDAGAVVRRPDLERAGRLERALHGAHAGLLDRRSRVAAALIASGPGGGLVATLALGARGGVGGADREAFARLGVAHVLAVSGLHLALVIGAAHWGLLGLARRSPALLARRDVRPLARVVAVSIGAGYALLCGFGLPMQRALIFALAWLVGSICARRIGPVQVLACAVALLAWLDPGSVFDPGAHLSFAAASGLLLARRTGPARKPLPDRSARPARWLVGGREAVDRMLETSVLCIAVTAPILATIGLPTGLPGLVANPVLLPWTGVVLLPVSLLAALASLLELPGAVSAVALAERCAAATLSLVAYCAAHLPETGRGMPPVGWATLLAACTAMGVVWSPRRLHRLALTIGIVALLSLAPTRRGPERLPGVPRLVALDVGQGDATLIQGRSAALLVDGGRAGLAGFDAGARVVVPALSALGVGRLDLVVATHADIDHRGGLVAVLRAFEVGALWLPRGGLADPSFASLIDAARARGAPVREVWRDGHTHSIGDLAVGVLWPPLRPWGASRNDDSVVLRVEVDGTKMLLTGDVGAAAERALLAAPAELLAAVLKVGHHGSATSSGEGFLRAVAPHVAIVPAPCGGRAGLPSREALARLETRGIEIGWTGRDGAVGVALGRDRDPSATPPGVRAFAPARHCTLH